MRSLLCALVLLAVFAACRASPAIDCARNSDCPEGAVCEPTYLFCVQAGDADASSEGDSGFVSDAGAFPGDAGASHDAGLSRDAGSEGSDAGGLDGGEPADAGPCGPGYLCRWRRVADLPHARYRYASFWESSTSLVIVSGTSNEQEDRNALRYDEITGDWSDAGFTPFGDAYAASIRLSASTALLVGRERTAVRNAAGAWSEIPDAGLELKIEFALAALNDGRILRVGGKWGTAKDTAEVFDPVARKWIATAPMQFARVSPVPITLGDGRVLVTGGTEATRATEIFDPVGGTWSPGPVMNKVRVGHVVVPLEDNRYLLTAGESDGGTSEVYNAATATFEDVRTVPWIHLWHGVASARLANGRVIIGGGREGTETSIYDPATKSWTAGPPMMTPSKQGYFRFERLPSGRIVAPGGVELSFGEATARVEVLE